jgi:hypothetical protein
MPTSVRSCEHFGCGLPFQENRYDATLNRVVTPGWIPCPHCGRSHSGDPASIFLTHALSPDEEKDFVRQERLQNQQRYAGG